MFRFIGFAVLGWERCAATLNCVDVSVSIRRCAACKTNCLCAKQRDGLFEASNSEEMTIRTPLDAFNAQPFELVGVVVTNESPKEVAICSIDENPIAHGRSLPNGQPTSVWTPLQSLRIDSLWNETLDHAHAGGVERHAILGTRAGEESEDGCGTTTAAMASFCKFGIVDLDALDFRSVHDVMVVVS